MKIGGNWLTYRVRRLRQARRLRQVRRVCSKEITESEMERNFEIPPVLSSYIEGNVTQILLSDHQGLVGMDIGRRTDGRNFFLMRQWKAYRASRNMAVGTKMEFWTTAYVNTFSVHIWH